MEDMKEIISMYDAGLSQIGTLLTDLANLRHWTSLRTVKQLILAIYIV